MSQSLFVIIFALELFRISKLVYSRFTFVSCALLFRNAKQRTILSCWYSNKVILDTLCDVKASKLKAIIGVVATIMVLMISNSAFYQDASALKPVVKFRIVADEFDFSPIPNGGFLKIHKEKDNTARILFSAIGIDDNDKIKEFRCSWDGVNYKKSNCLQHEIGTSQEQIVGPDGITRNYFYGIGTAVGLFTPPPVPKTYTFGIQVVNVNNDLSPPAIWKFKIRPSTNDLPVQEEMPNSKPAKYQVSVQFNSITVHNDHDGFLRGAGEFVNYAYVQGNRVILNMHVDSGQTISFNPFKHSVLLEENIPLSIFTVGNEEDCNVALSRIHPPEYLTDLGQIFKDPNLDWSQAVSQAQTKIFNEYLTCKGNKLGTINEVYSPSNYEAGLHEVKSSNGDFTLRYTIYVSHAPQ